jgi:hypothetical protein
MFAPDTLFYGTTSPELVTNPEGVFEYFRVALGSSRHYASHTTENYVTGSVGQRRFDLGEVEG